MKLWEIYRDRVDGLLKPSSNVYLAKYTTEDVLSGKVLESTK